MAPSSGYGPLPTRKVGRFPNDDMMTEAMQGQWGDGRDDLAIMAEMGATMATRPQREQP